MTEPVAEAFERMAEQVAKTTWKHLHELVMEYQRAPKETPLEAARASLLHVLRWRGVTLR